MTIKDGKATFTVRSIVKSVNNKYADGKGNIDLGNLVKSVNNQTADANGNVDIGSIVKSLVVNISEASLNETGYVLFTNGLQICWGHGSGTSCNFARAFNNKCFVVLASNTNGETCLGRTIKSRSKSGFNTGAGGHGNSHWDANGTAFNYIAIGN